MPDKPKDERRNIPEEINPAPWMGRVGDGATLPSGEFISREIRELTERARHHRADQSNADRHRGDK
jgi:hypothetical protein